MFQEIRLRGLGVIDDAVLELGPGLNVLTGETGAGKTMVVSGLGLLLGGRADSGLVRTGDSMATVEGTIELPAGHPALVRAQDAGGDTDDGLVLLRSVSSEGRSRAHVGGRSAPVGTLAQIGRLLVAVHGQADQWRLRSSAQHREILDDFGGPPLREALTAYLRCFDDWETTRAEALRLRALATASRRDAELLRAGLEYIEAVHPQPGEDLTLRVEDERLAHADGLRTSALQAQALLAGGDDAAESPAGYGAPGGSVRELLSAARGAVAGMSVHDPALSELDGRLAELGYLVADLSADLAHYGAQVEVDPARLAWVQQRRSELASLVRRYGDSVDDVLDWARESAARFEELAGAGERAELLEIEATALRAELARRAATLSQARSAAAAELSTRITGELSQLAMTSAAVHVAVRQRPDPEGLSVGGEPVRATRTGIDDVEIELRANSGDTPRSVARAASGGELSRVMLAIEVVCSAGGADAAVPTMVFDEVDAGVGGRAALSVGARLAELARHTQVIVVTHLAQVAAFGDQHLVVRKGDDGSVTSSSVTRVAGDARLRELARMMSGDDHSEAGLVHAAELLGQAASIRDGPVAARTG